MPDHLKSILVDDWENVTKNLQLAHVPAKIPVNVILDEYLEQERARRGDGTSSFDLLNEVISGMRQYFNKGLGRILLYKYERGQYDEILHRIADPKDEIAGKQLGDVYGAEHLLRLFGKSQVLSLASLIRRAVSLPELIAQTNMDQQSASRLREELHNLTMWMSKEKNILRYLSSPYEYQGYDYQEKVSVVHWFHRRAFANRD
jgi:mortality factor 4-like protein 1